MDILKSTIKLRCMVNWNQMLKIIYIRRHRCCCCWSFQLHSLVSEKKFIWNEKKNKSNKIRTVKYTQTNAIDKSMTCRQNDECHHPWKVLSYAVNMVFICTHVRWAIKIFTNPGDLVNLKFSRSANSFGVAVYSRTTCVRVRVRVRKCNRSEKCDSKILKAYKLARWLTVKLRPT